MESADFEWIVMAIRIQREVGGNLAELLLNVAATLREREYLRRQVKALSAEGRFSAYILLALPPGFIAYMMPANPAYVQPAVTTPIGYVMLGVHGRCLMVLGAVHDEASWSRWRSDDARRSCWSSASPASSPASSSSLAADRGLHQRGARRLQVARRARGVLRRARRSMKEELDPSFNDRVLTPLLARFVGLGQRLTPDGLRRAHPAASSTSPATRPAGPSTGSSR